MAKVKSSPIEPAEQMPPAPPENNLNDIVAENERLSVENDELKLALSKAQLELAEAYARMEELESLPIAPAAKKGTAETNVPTETFESNGALYKFNVGVVNVRQLGKRTALDIIADDTAHAHLGGLSIKEWLVANNSTAISRME